MQLKCAPSLTGILFPIYSVRNHALFVRSLNLLVFSQTGAPWSVFCISICRPKAGVGYEWRNSKVERFAPLTWF